MKVYIWNETAEKKAGHLLAVTWKKIKQKNVRKKLRYLDLSGSSIFFVFFPKLCPFILSLYGAQKVNYNKVW